MNVKHFLLSLFVSLSAIAQDIEPDKEIHLATPAETAMSALASLKGLARKEGWELTNAQTLFAGDMLMGYYSRQMKPPNTQSNLVWLPVEKNLREHMLPVIELFGKMIDPFHNIEHLRLEDYLKRDPKAMASDMQRHRRKILIMDDMAELHFIDLGVKQTPEISTRLNRANDYDEWLMMDAPEDLTIFVIDEDGFVLANMHDSFLPLIDFVGDNGEIMTMSSCVGLLKN